MRTHRLPSFASSSFLPCLCFGALVIVLLTLPARAAEDLSVTLQRGLFEEEANNNLTAAIKAYESVVAATDAQRKLAGTALFRLAECYRKLGRTNDAATHYQRVVREYPDQQRIVDLSRQYLVGAGGLAEPTLSPSARAEQKRLLEEEIKIVETELKRVEELTKQGLVGQDAVSPKQRELLVLRRQLVALADAPANTAAAAPPTDEEEKEVRRIQALIKDSPDLINARSADSTTPLQEAARKGQLVVARFLLANRADVNMTGANGSAPLHEAASAGHKSMIELLLTNGANADARASSGTPGTRSGRTALRLAVDNGFKSIVEVLLAAKADPNLADGNGDTPLHIAAKNKLALAQLLLEGGAQVNASNKKGLTPLSNAATGSPQLTEYLLSKGADANTRDEYQSTPLHHAASTSCAGCITALVGHKADPNLANKDGNTPLHFAADMNQPPVVQALLAGGADPNARNNGWTTPLWSAVNKSSAENTAALLKAGAKPNLPNGKDPDSSWNALHWASSKSDKEIVRLLLEAGADPNVSVFTPYRSYATGRWTPLLMAVAEDSPAVTHMLLEAKANPNVRPAEGHASALIVAVFNRSTNIVADLLEHGADVESRDYDGAPALSRAIALNDLSLVELLLRHKASPNTKSLTTQSTPLHYAASSFKSKEVFDLLLSLGADPNVTDNNGRTPLELLTGGGAPASPQYGGVLGAQPRPILRPPSTPQFPALPAVPGLPSAPPPAPKTAPASELADRLRQSGALDEVPLMDRIVVQRAAAQKREVVFTQSVSNWNQFTLLELISVEYGFLSTFISPDWRRSWSAPYTGGIENQFRRNMMLPFPDLTQVKIRRLAPDRKSWKETKVDVTALLKTGDRTKDVPLEWGDVVEIPELDHSITEQWRGFDKETLFALKQMLSRQVSITVKGETLRTNLTPDIVTVKEYSSLHGGPFVPPTLSFGPGGTVVEPKDRSMEPAVQSNRRFTLHALLYDSGLLRSSSDASRVRLKRRDPVTGQTGEWTINAADPNARPDLWLRDGDQIEVPEK